jgi:hypothetical protein
MSVRETALGQPLEVDQIDDANLRNVTGVEYYGILSLRLRLSYRRLCRQQEAASHQRPGDTK